MQTLHPHIYAALAGFVPRATVHDIDPNRLACREENRKQMQARFEREKAAEQAKWADAVLYKFPALSKS